MILVYAPTKGNQDLLDHVAELEKKNGVTAEYFSSADKARSRIFNGQPVLHVVAHNCVVPPGCQEPNAETFVIRIRGCFRGRSDAPVFEIFPAPARRITTSVQRDLPPAYEGLRVAMAVNSVGQVPPTDGPTPNRAASPNRGWMAHKRPR